MVSRLLLEKLVEGGRVSAEANGNLSCFMIVDNTSMRLNERRFDKLNGIN